MDLFDIRMIIGIGQDTCDDSPLGRHLHALLIAKLLYSRFRHLYLIPPNVIANSTRKLPVTKADVRIERRVYKAQPQKLDALVNALPVICSS